MSQGMHQRLSLINIFKGVEEGLSKYSGLSRVALVFAPQENDPVLVFDPKNILRGHEPKLKDIYIDNYSDWQGKIKEKYMGQPHGYILPGNDIDLSGLISYAGYSKDFFYQRWFTDHHPDMCSIYPTQRWLEQAASLLAYDYNSESSALNSSDYVVKNYSLQAIADFILDERGMMQGFDSRIMLPTVLNNILNISNTKEEGAWPRGILFFTDPYSIDQIEFITKFQKNEQPWINNIKHIRKLLVAVEHSSRKLVSDGNTIIGLSDGGIPEYAVTADFRGDHGFLKLGNSKIASFFDGSFHSTTREAKMVELEELLMDSSLGPEEVAALFQLVSKLVHAASKRRYGCTIVLDLGSTPLKLSGHLLDPSLNLIEEKNFNLAASLLKIDGAVHIGGDMNIRGFGCLLDGEAIEREDMARGARYNSALRFSARHEQAIVVVVSSDRPVSIIHRGVQLSSFCDWQPLYQYMPKPVPIDKYIKGAVK